jgi:hypothetical protein
LRPHPDNTCSSKAADLFRVDHQQLSAGSLHVAIDAVIALPDFNRFVFVVSVLERYSDYYCSLLLGCSVQDVYSAREKAFEQLTGNTFGKKIFRSCKR